VIIPLTTFRDRLFQRLHLDQIVMQVADASTENIARLENNIKTLMRKQHRIELGQPDDFTVRTPMSISAESRLISENVFRLLFGLASISTLLSALIIGVIFHRAVTARREEIGLRRAIGASPSDILQQLWAEGLLVSFIGVVLGFGFGLVILWQLARWRQLPHTIDSTTLIAAIGILILTSVGPLLAGQTAAKTIPAEALRPAG
jgi:putative ABC transport system permease protein